MSRSMPLCSLLLLALAGCDVAPTLGPADAPDFLLGGSPLSPLAPAGVTLKSQVARDGTTQRWLEVGVLAPVKLVEPGKTEFRGGAGFWLNGDAIALADPRPSPVLSISPKDDDLALVVIALPLDDATGSAVAGAIKAGDAVDVAADIELLSTDGGQAVLGGVTVTGILIGL